VKATLASVQGTASVNVVPLQVTNTNDSGAGSLRQALLDTSLLPGQTHTLQFLLPTGPQTINLLSALPSVSDPLVHSLDATQNVTVVLSSGTVWTDNATMTLAGAGALNVRGGIKGTGNLLITGGSHLTAGHVIQNALVIGGAAGNIGNVIIGASDASGNPLISTLGAMSPSETTAGATASIAAAAATMSTPSTFGSPPIPLAIAPSLRSSNKTLGDSALGDLGNNDDKWSAPHTRSVVASNSHAASVAGQHAAIASNRIDESPYRDAVAASFDDPPGPNWASIPFSPISATDADPLSMLDEMLDAIARHWRRSNSRSSP
jgi:hypothetical protein